MQSGEKILIIRLSAIGDVVHVLPALRCLRRHRPYAYIAWLVEDRVADLLDGHPDLDEVIVFPRKRWREGLFGPLQLLKTVASVFRFFRNELRAKGFDVALDFQGNLKSGVMTYLSGAPVRVGFGKQDCREYNYLFTNRHAGPQQERAHRVEKYLSLLTALGIKPAYERSTIRISPEDIDYARKSMEACVSGPGPVVVIHPGTSQFGAYKRLPVKLLIELGDRLVEELDAQVVLTWGPDEEGMAKEIVSGMKGGGCLAPRSFNLARLAGIIGQADLFISVDTGPMHIASVLGVPQVAIFGPKDPAIYGPYNEQSRVVWKNVECSPCVKRTCNDPICITEITADEVFAAVRELLLSKKTVARDS